MEEERRGHSPSAGTPAAPSENGGDRYPLSHAPRFTCAPALVLLDPVQPAGASERVVASDTAASAALLPSLQLPFQLPSQLRLELRHPS